jgi:hypothetical protein
MVGQTFVSQNVVNLLLGPCHHCWRGRWQAGGIIIVISTRTNVPKPGSSILGIVVDWRSTLFQCEIKGTSTYFTI